MGFEVAVSSRKTIAGAGAIALAIAFLPTWEGTDLTAQVDPIGTGHPVTYCSGITSEAGQVKPGQKFTKEQCDDLLKTIVPKYWDGIAPCIKVDLSDKVKAALISAAYNAGPAAVCKSPMVAKMNAGDVTAGCNAFAGWYVRASGRVVKGLINRRNAEKELCLEGASEPKPAPIPPSLWQRIITKLKGFRLWH